MTKKALVLTGVNKKLQSLIPIITNKQEEDLIVVHSIGCVISQPYGCMIRNILFAVYYENVGEVYLIGEERNNQSNSRKEDLSSKIHDAGISEKTIQTINFIEVVKPDFISWLTGPEDEKSVIQNNMKLIKENPVIPKTLPIYGFIANGETGKFEVVHS
jgi:carbonic anhydrase